jgi:hypothetical protein
MRYDPDVSRSEERPVNDNAVIVFHIREVVSGHELGNGDEAKFERLVLLGEFDGGIGGTRLDEELDGSVSNVAKGESAENITWTLVPGAGATSLERASPPREGSPEVMWNTR